MKILSIPNQNLKNRAIAFGGFKSVIAGESYREDNHFIALALRLTKDDLQSFKDILKTFPNPKQESDVLHISVAGFDGNFDSPYSIYINHNDTYGTNMLTSKFTGKIIGLLSRIYGARKIDFPIKNSEEETKMLKTLIGDSGYTFNQDELGISHMRVQRVSSSLSDIINKSTPIDEFE